MVALALTGLGARWFWQTKEVRLLFGVGITGLLLALGNSDIFHGILYSIAPMFEKAREPENAIYLFHFAIAVLVAFGMDALLQLRQPDCAARPRNFILLGFGAVAFFIVFGVFHGSRPKMDRRRSRDDHGARLLRAGRSGLPDEPVRNSLRHGIPVLMVALYLVELGNSALFYLPNKEEANRNTFLSHLDDTREVADFLRHQPAPVRVWTNMDDVPFNFGDWYGIDSLFSGYDAQHAGQLLANRSAYSSRPPDFRGRIHRQP